MAGAKGCRDFAGGLIARDGVFEDRDLAVQHADVDFARGAGLFALEQRRIDARAGEHARGQIAYRSADPGRTPTGLPGQTHHPPHRLYDEVVCWAFAQRSRVAKARDLGVN